MNNQNQQTTPVSPVNQVPVNQNSQGTSNDTKTIVTVLLLIFIYPVGFVLMWVWTKWKTWVKILISALSCLPIIFIMISFFAVGFLAVLNPAAQIQKGKCVSQCETSIDKTTCVQTCIEKFASPSPSTLNEE